MKEGDNVKNEIKIKQTQLHLAEHLRKIILCADAFCKHGNGIILFGNSALYI